MANKRSKRSRKRLIKSDLLDARLIARMAQERQELDWEDHPLSRDPDEVRWFSDGNPGFLYYIDSPIRIFGIKHMRDPRNDLLEEMHCLHPVSVVSAFNRSGKRIDLSMIEASP
jgi:hypothetical protein